MHICRLALDHFRSWNEIVVDFTSGVNVLHGANGLGKTNLVEAVEVLSTGTSHRVSASLPLIKRGTSKATIRANVDDNSSLTTYEATVAAHGANRARINSGQSQYLRDIIGLVPSVSFTPEDQRLIYGEPSVRRNLLNQSGVLLMKQYAEQLQQFTHIARQRAALLKQLAGREGMVDSALSGLEVWTGQFIENGVELTRMRSSLVSRLAEPFAEIYGRLSSNNGKACLAYVPSFEETLVSDDPYAAISEHFQRVYPGEVARGINLIGPQRDDVNMTLDGMPAKEFASNGEMWTMAIALKMAIFETVAEAREMKPIVILDDVFAQLDESRREQIVQFAQQQDQVLITVAAASDIPAAVDANMIDVAPLRESSNTVVGFDAALSDKVHV